MSDAGPSLRERLQVMLAEYGGIALATHLIIYALVFVAAAIAIRAGTSFEGVSGSAGTLAAAYVAAKLTMPVRIPITLALTPIVASIVRRWRGKHQPQ